MFLLFVMNYMVHHPVRAHVGQNHDLYLRRLPGAGDVIYAERQFKCNHNQRRRKMNSYTQYHKPTCWGRVSDEVEKKRPFQANHQSAP